MSKGHGSVLNKTVNTAICPVVGSEYVLNEISGSLVVGFQHGVSLK